MFGAEARRLMTVRELSLREVARRIPCDPGGLSRTLNGLSRPSKRIAERLDQVLGAGGSLLALRASTQDDLARLAAAVRRPRQVDLRAVGALEKMLASQRRLEDLLGSTALLPSVRAQLDLVTRMVVGARGANRVALLDVAAQWAQFAGWLHTDNSDRQLARLCYLRAADWAAEAGNADLVATAFSMRGHLAWTAGAPGPMIRLSQAALACPGPLSAGVTALAAQQAARGHALVGAADDMDRGLDDAERSAALAAEHADEQPAWTYFHNPAYLAMQRGLACLLLGRDSAAEASLQHGLGALAPDVRGSAWAGGYVARLAEAQARLGEVEQACANAAMAADIARVTESAWLDARVRALVQRIAAAWPGAAGVAELAGALDL